MEQQQPFATARRSGPLVHNFNWHRWCCLCLCQGPCHNRSSCCFCCQHSPCMTTAVALEAATTKAEATLRKSLQLPLCNAFAVAAAASAPGFDAGNAASAALAGPGPLWPATPAATEGSRRDGLIFLSRGFTHHQLFPCCCKACLHRHPLRAGFPIGRATNNEFELSSLYIALHLLAKRLGFAGS